MLEVRLLGQFDVRWEGTPIAISSRASQLLLAYLLLNPGIAHRRESLAGTLWPDTTDETARGKLRHELWRLRKAIEPKVAARGAIPCLVVDELAIGWNAASSYWLDVSIVQTPLGADSADQLAGKLAHARGDLLPGTYEEWVIHERRRIQGIVEQKMARLLELLLEEERWQDTLEWGERWIALGQSPEPAYRALMVAHRALGNGSQVALVYNRCVRAMRDDLGVEPSETTRALFEQLSKYEKIPPVSHAPATRAPLHQPENRAEPSLPPPLSRPRQLPVPLTSFIGREKEMSQLELLLSKSRLLTLTGAGGVGKTRLAIELAGDVANRFKDGVWWVDLGALADPALVPQVVAERVGVREIPRVPLVDQLAEALCSEEGLLVIDNCEHLIAACANLAQSLLGTCTSVRILMTSREALRIVGEASWRVPSLAIPELTDTQDIEKLSKSESVRLFVERAISVRPNFALTTEIAPAVARIARRLDGIPLAIELAAAYVRTLSVNEIATRLEHGFDLLTHGSRTALPHHQTLLGTMDWGYRLLSRKEQLLLRRLSAFAGGFTVEAAEAVCVDAPSARPSTDNSKSHEFPDPRHEQTQSAAQTSPEAGGASNQGSDNIIPGDVLDLLYALEEKSLVEVEHEEHVRYHLLETVRQYAWAKALETDETDRLQDRHLGFFTAMAEQAEPQLRSAEQPVWLNRLDLELDNLRHALRWALTGNPPKTANLQMGTRLAAALSQFWVVHGHLREGRQWVAQVLSPTFEKADQATLPRAKALIASGVLAYYHGELQQAAPACEEGSRLARELDAKWLLGLSLVLLGQYQSRNLRDFQRAEALAGESVAIARELGDKWLVAMALWNLGILARHQGHQSRATSLFEEGLRLGRDSGDPWLTAGLLDDAGSQEYIRGNYDRAMLLHEEGLALRRNLKDSGGIAGILHDMGRMARCQGDTGRAELLYEESLARFRELDQKESVAVVLNSLGYAEVARGLVARAVSLFQESMMIFRELGIAEGVVISMTGIAVTACAKGQVERAGRLFGATNQLLGMIGASIPFADRGEYERMQSEARAQLGEVVFEAVQAEGQAMTMDQAMTYALDERH